MAKPLQVPLRFATPNHLWNDCYLKILCKHRTHVITFQLQRTWFKSSTVTDQYVLSFSVDKIKSNKQNLMRKIQVKDIWCIFVVPTLEVVRSDSSTRHRGQTKFIAICSCRLSVFTCHASSFASCCYILSKFIIRRWIHKLFKISYMSAARLSSAIKSANIKILCRN